MVKRLHHALCPRLFSTFDRDHWTAVWNFSTKACSWKSACQSNGAFFFGNNKKSQKLAPDQSYVAYWYSKRFRDGILVKIPVWLKNICTWWLQKLYYHPVKTVSERKLISTENSLWGFPPCYRLSQKSSKMYGSMLPHDQIYIVQVPHRPNYCSCEL